MPIRRVVSLPEGPRGTWLDPMVTVLRTGARNKIHRMPKCATLGGSRRSVASTQVSLGALTAGDLCLNCAQPLRGLGDAWRRGIPVITDPRRVVALAPRPTLPGDRYDARYEVVERCLFLEGPPPWQSDPSESWYLGVLPYDAFRWVRTWAPTTMATQIGFWEPGDTPAVLETAVSLWDAGSYGAPLSDLADALTAARVVCGPHTQR